MKSLRSTFSRRSSKSLSEDEPQKLRVELSWIRHNPSLGLVPSARWGHVFTNCRSKIYVVGGSGMRLLSDTYVMDTNESAWKVIPSVGECPTGRYGHAAAAVQDRLYVFGGRGGSDVYNDTFILHTDSGQWERLSITEKAAPKSRYAHSCVSFDNRIFMFGGYGHHDSVYSDLFVFDERTGSWIKEKTSGDVPSGRGGHSANVIDNRMYVYGGFNFKKSLNDMYILDLVSLTWTKVESVGDKPSARNGHSCVLVDGLLILMGGVTGDDRVVNDTWVFNPENNRWFSVLLSGDTPSPRFKHRSTVVGTKKYIFGGASSVDILPNELYTLECGNIRALINQPSTRTPSESAKSEKSAGSSRDLVEEYHELERKMNQLRQQLKKEGNVEVSSPSVQSVQTFSDHTEYSDTSSISGFSGASSHDSVVSVTPSNMNKLLRKAVYSGDMGLLERIASHGPDFSVKDYDNRTLLHIASVEGHLPVVEFLVNKTDIDIYAADRWGNTASDDAKRAGEINVFNFLQKCATQTVRKLKVEPPPSLNLSSELLAAAGEGNTELVTELLQRGANVNSIDSRKRTPLHRASSEGHFEVARLLVQAGAKIEMVDDQGKDAISIAFLNHRTDVVSFLRDSALSSGNYSVDLQTRILTAAANGDLETLKSYYSPTAYLCVMDYDKRTPLHLAAAGGHLHIVQFLVQLGASVNATDRWDHTPIQDALLGGHEAVEKFLSSQGGIVVTDHGQNVPALFQAASQGKVELVKKFVVNGADLKSCDYDKRTLLHLAAVGGHLQLVEFLVEAGMNVNVEDRWGNTPLKYAITHIHDDVATFLKSHGGVVLDSFEDSTMALMTAASKGNIGKLRYLKDSGCNFNIFDSNMRTPLHLAASEGHYEVVEFLLSLGVKPAPTDSFGGTPYRDALQNGHEKVAALLKKHAENRKKTTITSASGECCLRFGDGKAYYHLLFQKLLDFGLKSMYQYAEIWTTDKNKLYLENCTIWSTNREDAAIQRFHEMSLSYVFEPDVDVIGRVYSKKTPEFISSIPETSQLEFLRLPLARVSKIKTCHALPVFSGGEVIAVAGFFSLDPRRADLEFVSSFENYALKATKFTTLYADLMRGSISRGDFSSGMKDLLMSDDTPSEKLQLIYQFVLDLKCLDTVFEWAYSMNSEEHISCINILVALATSKSALATALVEPFKVKLVESLKLLATVSPLHGPKILVRPMAEKALGEMVASQSLDYIARPYFGRKCPSPIMQTIYSLKGQYERTFSEFIAKHGESAPDIRKNTSLIGTPFSLRDVSDIVGMRPSTGSGSFHQTSREHLQNQSIALTTTTVNEIMQSSQIFTTENILKLHETLNLDGDVKRAQYRNIVTVGSVYNYQFYRVFLPPEEIPSAMQYMQSILTSAEMGRRHPAIQTYYAYSAFVYYIHPFEDGNGRTSRLLANMYLRKAGFPPLIRAADKNISFEDFLSRLKQMR